MKPALANILIILAGVLASGLVVALVEGLGMSFFPVPVEVMQNQEDLARIPLGAKLSVVVAWVVGSFAGGCVTALLHGRRAQARVVGIIMLALVLSMLMTIPHPLWMSVSGLVLPLPAALVGGRMCRRTGSD